MVYLHDYMSDYSLHDCSGIAPTHSGSSFTVPVDDLSVIDPSQHSITHENTIKSRESPLRHSTRSRDVEYRACALISERRAR
jgi:hypothetical protein